ncbi:MAG: hypothetical protein M9918_22310 [Anaerolineae bacterium]|nr:hypothetical protein [Anaerolineae bacterium]
MTTVSRVTATSTLPTWLTVLTAALVVFNFLVFGLLTLLNPTLTFPDAGQGGIFPTQFMAIRHIALAIPLLHGLLTKDVKILTTMYTIFFVMAVLDVLLLAINSNYYIPLVVSLIGPLPFIVTVLLSAGLFIVPMSLTLRHLRTNYA